MEGNVVCAFSSLAYTVYWLLKSMISSFIYFFCQCHNFIVCYSRIKFHCVSGIFIIHLSVDGYLNWFHVFFLLLYWYKVLLCSSDCPGTHSTHKTGLELIEIFMYYTSKSWDYRHKTWCLTWICACAGISVVGCLRLLWVFTPRWDSWLIW